MNDWEALIHHVPWLVNADSRVCVFESDRGIHLPAFLTTAFPSLASLLAKSRVTQVSIDSSLFQLLAWNTTNGHPSGWLCLPADAAEPDLASNLYPDHAELLDAFGGIIERFNEPDDSWLLNCHDALTRREAAEDASFINDCAWAFEEAGFDVPIHLSDYYSLAREANGNTTICHRTTGQVLLFAPDHAFDHVVPYENSPEYTLYRLHGIAHFRDWVETIAQQWLTAR